MANDARTLIKRAFRLIGAIDSEEPLDASQADDALGVLNALLAEMHFAGVGLPDYSMSSLSDTMASDIADREALAYQLAIRLAPEYGFEVPQSLVVMSEQSMSRLRLRYFQPGDSDFSELPTTRTTYNVNNE